MVARRDERITRLALTSANRGGRLKAGDDAPQFIETIKVDAIDPDPAQPRRHFDPERLQELADSLTQSGQLQPIVVVRAGERFTLLVGERRWRASKLAGLLTIRALVRSTPLEAQAALIAQIAENEQRADLSTTELVEAVRQLSILGLKNADIARALGKAPPRVSELQGLAEAPPALAALTDTLGLSLSYQLLRQWRALPAETLEFVAHMPAEHISRLTIATIGQEAGPGTGLLLNPMRAAPSVPGSDGGDEVMAASGGEGQGRGRSPRTVVPAAAGASGSSDPRAHAAAPRSASLIGSVELEHAEHGVGRMLFGLETPADHLAAAFGDRAPVILHKDEVRIVRALGTDGTKR